MKTANPAPRHYGALAALLCLLAAGARADPVGALVDEGRALQAQPATAATEQRLHQIAATLASSPGGPATRAWLEALAQREPRILVRHEEGPALVPVADPGAAARAALRNWDRSEARERGLRALRAGGATVIEDYFSAGAVARLGLLDAISAADAAWLSVHRNEVGARVEEPGGDRLAAAFGLALADATLLERVISTGSPQTVGKLIGGLDARVDADTTLRLLIVALDRPELTSMALFRIGALDHPAVDAMIWAALADPGLGATAAAILARRADRDLVRRLGKLLHSEDSSTRNRALLALQLSGDPHAARLVRDWQARP